MHVYIIDISFFSPLLPSPFCVDIIFLIPPQPVISDTGVVVEGGVEGGGGGRSIGFFINKHWELFVL